jgi:hypothetical protein
LKHLSHSVIAAACLGLCACGGGGSDSPSFPFLLPPTATTAPPAAAPAGTGDTGSTGSTDDTGTPRRGVLGGPSDPTADIGTDGDYYLNYASLTLFGPKAAGAWPAGVSLRGSDGVAGPAGPAGAMVRYGAVDPAGSATTATSI